MENRIRDAGCGILFFLLATLYSLLSALPAYAGMSEKEWSDAQKSFTAEYNKPDAKKDGNLRVAAIEKLKGVEHPKMVKLLTGQIIPQELNSDYPMTIDAAVTVLSQLSDDECIKELISEATNAQTNVKIVLIRAMGLINKSDVIATLISFLKIGDSKIRVSTVDALSHTAPKEALSEIIALFEAKEWEVRASVANYLAKVKDEESKALAAEALSKQSDKESGRLRNDMLNAVKLLGDKEIPISGTGETVAVFYGLKIDSKNPVFVVDVSASMRMYKAKEGGSRFEVLIKELKNVVSKLPLDTNFNIIAFNDEVIPWQRNLVSVKQYQKQALDWIDKLKSAKLTNIYDALEAAFGFTPKTKTPVSGYYNMKGTGADTIYFMSDGEPTAGKYLKTDEILSAIRALNQTRKIRINTIAVGVGGGEMIQGAMDSGGSGGSGGMPGGGGHGTGKIDEEFMKKLAEENYGVYIEK